MSAPRRRNEAASGLMCDEPTEVVTWLRDRGVNIAGEVSINRVGVGQSNIATIVSAEDGREWVLREPPPGTHAQSAHDVAREARIVSSLRDSGIPVPRVIGTGVTPGGAAFFVMERVPGAPLESEEDAAALSGKQRKELGLQAIRTMASLHTLEPASVGLADLGRPSAASYVERQIRRLATSWDRTGQDSRHDKDWHTWCTPGLAPHCLRWGGR